MFVVIQENASEKLVSASKSFSHVGILYQVADIVEFETIIQYLSVLYLDLLKVAVFCPCLHIYILYIK